MDSLRGFDEEYGSPSDEEPAMERPPEIGVDERRMHVRAYNHWVSLLDGRDYPSIEDLDVENVGDFGPHGVLLDFTCGAENPGTPFIGHKLAEECGLPGTITEISQVPKRSLLSRLTDHYLQIIANRAPIGFEAEFVSQRGCSTMYRGILMPLSSDGDTIDFIYGVINWKELADAGTTAAINGQIDAALALAPAAPHSPVWADGPSAEHEGPPASNPTAGTVAIGHFDELPEIAEGPGEVDAFGDEIRPADPDDDADDGGAEAVSEGIDDAVAADVVADEDEDEDTRVSELPQGAGLADRLCIARETAEAVKSADTRSRVALYRALGQAYDFALAAAQAPDDYLEILDDAGLKAQARAPMTPIAKLIFGAEYDKTRLTEFATALGHGVRLAVPADEFTRYLERFPGGLKGVVAAERAARHPAGPRSSEVDRDALRAAPALAFVDGLPGSDEFVILLARREADGTLGVVAEVSGDDTLLDRAIRKASVAL